MFPVPVQRSQYPYFLMSKIEINVNSVYTFLREPCVFLLLPSTAINTITQNAKDIATCMMQKKHSVKTCLSGEQTFPYIYICTYILNFFHKHLKHHGTHEKQNQAEIYLKVWLLSPFFIFTFTSNISIFYTLKSILEGFPIILILQSVPQFFIWISIFFNKYP